MSQWTVNNGNYYWNSNSVSLTICNLIPLYLQSTSWYIRLQHVITCVPYLYIPVQSKFNTSLIELLIDWADINIAEVFNLLNVCFKMLASVIFGIAYFPKTVKHFSFILHPFNVKVLTGNADWSQKGFYTGKLRSYLLRWLVRESYVTVINVEAHSLSSTVFSDRHLNEKYRLQ